MSLQVERQLTIMSILRNKQTVSVNELSKILKVAPNTIRRDLDQLDKEGVLKRIQGGAVLNEINKFVQPFEQRQGENTEEKIRIGRLAASLVENNDTIIIDSGTTTLEMARNLNHLEKLTILTNSIEIPHVISNQNFVIILSGGILRETSKSLIGLPAEQFFAQFNADKVFIGTGGISIENGLTNPNIQETPVKRRMIDAVKEVIVLAHSQKFGKASLSPFCSIKNVDKIVTDANIEDEIRKEYKKLGVEILLA